MITPRSRFSYLLILLVQSSLVVLLFTGQSLKRNVHGKGGALILNSADSLFLQDDLETASKELNKLIESDPENPYYYYNLGLMERSLDKGNGLPWFRKAHQKKQDSPRIDHML
ncbi:tetratricopeptide repeat protein, partial [Calditrichota bacterium]